MKQHIPSEPAISDGDAVEFTLTLVVVEGCAVTVVVLVRINVVVMNDGPSDAADDGTTGCGVTVVVWVTVTCVVLAPIGGMSEDDTMINDGLANAVDDGARGCGVTVVVYVTVTCVVLSPIGGVSDNDTTGMALGVSDKAELELSREVDTTGSGDGTCELAGAPAGGLGCGLPQLMCLIRACREFESMMLQSAFCSCVVSLSNSK